MRSRVVPGISEVTDLRCPINRLNSVDFPTLGLPTRATTAFAISHPTKNKKTSRRLGWFKSAYLNYVAL
jgi:hypothetical protein